MNSLLKEYDKQVKNPCAKAKKMSENFSENPCNQPKRLFFLDFSIVFAKFSPLPRLPFFFFACIMRVFSFRRPIAIPQSRKFPSTQ